MSDWNERIIAEFRETGTTSMFGDGLVIMHTIGAKSGETRLTPVASFPDAEAGSADRFVIGSAAGSPRDPAWAHNLRAHPDIDVEMSNGDAGVGTVAMTATETPADERDELWTRFTAVAPGFLEYTKKTDRVFPIFRLSPRV